MAHRHCLRHEGEGHEPQERRSVVVRVNDRGPFVGHRIGDLSRAAAETLGMMKRGVARARFEILGDAASAGD